MFNTFFGRFLLGFGLVVIAFLQYLIWFGEGGFADRRTLKNEMSHLQAEIAALEERNRSLVAEVDDLKTGFEAVEEYARLDLGLIKPGETFIQKSTFAESVGARNAAPASTVAAAVQPIAVTEDAPPDLLPDNVPSEEHNAQLSTTAPAKHEQ